MTEVRAHVFLFRPRFVEPIRKGTKTQTLRKDRPRRPAPNELLSPRAWRGTPYRTPQYPIVPPVRCKSVAEVGLNLDYGRRRVSVWVGGEPLTPAEVGDFVRRDGFDDLDDFLWYWRPTGIDRFQGIVIEWHWPPKPEAP